MYNSEGDVLYTNVREFEDWINDVMKQNSYVLEENKNSSSCEKSALVLILFLLAFLLFR